MNFRALLLAGSCCARTVEWLGLSRRISSQVRHIFRIGTISSTMVKRRTKGAGGGDVGSSQEKSGDAHRFMSDEEVTELRKSLLEWYDANKRDLPWRRLAKLDDVNQRAYSVWVSEIMLQQTQVATVIDYYNKWIKKWPTVEDLAKASLEEVNEMWSGLGYYSRGRRLHEGAVKVVNELGGHMPGTAGDLIEQLPGVGKYTAGAIASIALNEVTGLVDGNVSRVFSRLRMIGADIGSQAVTDALWQLAEQLVDPERPGDFNQALMELGATVCTPKAVDCTKCPLQQHCSAYKQVEQQKMANSSRLGQNATEDIEDISCRLDGCSLCFSQEDSWDESLGVMNYPRKGKKKAAREERTAVGVVEQYRKGEPHYLIVQRPEKGLLAGLWEFPSVILENDNTENKGQKELSTYLQDQIKAEKSSFENQTWKYIGEVVHIFSHIHQTYVVNSLSMAAKSSFSLEESTSPARWVTKDQLLASAISTAMKKVFKAFETNGKTTGKGAGKKLGQDSKDGMKQLSMAAFFKPKS